MKIVKTEEEVYNETLNYINGSKHNRPSTLSPIKKELRSQRIVDLIFSRPDIFDLTKEFNFVPKERITDEILVKYILFDSKNFSKLDESLQTTPALIAFEFSKRRYEHLSAMSWGMYGEKIEDTKKYREYRDSISDLCDNLSINYDDEDILKSFSHYIDVASKAIFEYLKSNIELEKEENFEVKYELIRLNLDKKLYILVSGLPDSGKTTFSKILSSKIEESLCFDSDMLFDSGKIDMPLESISNKYNVIVFSDIYAYNFFTKEELGDSIIINILLEPVSIEKMYRNSKYMQGIPFEEYRRNEIDNIMFEEIDDMIHVTNTYDDRIYKEVDSVIEKILNRTNNMSEKSPVIVYKNK